MLTGDIKHQDAKRIDLPDKDPEALESLFLILSPMHLAEMTGMSVSEKLVFSNRQLAQRLSGFAVTAGSDNFLQGVHVSELWVVLAGR